MKNRIIQLFCLFLILESCSNHHELFENKEFESYLDSYIFYIDSSSFRRGYDYIYIESKVKNDCTFFSIYNSGSAYTFLKESSTIIDFFRIKNHDIMLAGDFPNKIVQIKKNMNLNILKIVKKRYKSEYDHYLEHQQRIIPGFYDYMEIELIFKDKKLVCIKKPPMSIDCENK